MPSSLKDRPRTHTPARLVLASASPRRRDLLKTLGLEFEVLPADIPEIPTPGEGPETTVLRFAREKAHAVAQRRPVEPRTWVLGSDTIVVLENQILGKPRDAAHALELLTALTGRNHRVITAVVLADSTSPQEFSVVVESQVYMRPAAREELEAYVATGEPLDKAGAYALQGEGRRFVDSVQGSETNVIGLPVAETVRLLESAARFEERV